MTAIEDARAALAQYDRAGIHTVLTTVPAVVLALRDLIAEHERLTSPPTDDVDPVVAVQTWMAADVHAALGRGNITEPNDGDRSWSDWWARLLHDVRALTAPPTDAKTWDRVHNRPADIYTPPEDRVVPPADGERRERIRSAVRAMQDDDVADDEREALDRLSQWVAMVTNPLPGLRDHHEDCRVVVAMLHRQGSITDAHDAELRAAYPEVEAFAARMREELWSNRHKGDHAGWRSMTLRQAWGEISWHVAKMAGALKAEDVAQIRELAADVANGAMMLDDILLVSGVADVCRCGTPTHKPSPGCAWHEQREAARDAS